jgi:hypothetical protein
MNLTGGNWDQKTMKQTIGVSNLKIMDGEDLCNN